MKTGIVATEAQLLPYLVHRTAGVLARSWLDVLRGHGMTVARWQVLSILQEYDGSRVGELARMAAVEQPVMSRVVDQMERDGLVQRRPSPADARVTEVWLSRSGRRVFTTLLPEAERWVDGALAGIDAATVRAVSAALLTVMANVEGS